MAEIEITTIYILERYAFPNNMNLLFEAIFGNECRKNLIQFEAAKQPDLQILRKDIAKEKHNIIRGFYYELIPFTV